MPASEEGNLDKLPPPGWFNEPVVNVVLASKGYPGKYKKGSIIKGIDKANEMEGVVVFHAGTKLNDKGAVCTAGGRVLNITAQASSLEAAVAKAYEAVDNAIKWPGGFCRRDIAHHALKK